MKEHYLNIYYENPDNIPIGILNLLKRVRRLRRHRREALDFIQVNKAEGNLEMVARLKNCKLEIDRRITSSLAQVSAIKNLELATTKMASLLVPLIATALFFRRKWAWLRSHYSPPTAWKKAYPKGYSSKHYLMPNRFTSSIHESLIKTGYKMAYRQFATEDGFAVKLEIRGNYSNGVKWVKFWSHPEHKDYFVLGVYTKTT